MSPMTLLVLDLDDLQMLGAMTNIGFWVVRIAAQPNGEVQCVLNKWIGWLVGGLDSP